MRTYITSAAALADENSAIILRVQEWRDAASQYDQHKPYSLLKAVCFDVEGLARARCSGESLVRFLCDQLGVRRIDNMSAAAQRWARTALRDARLSKDSDEKDPKKPRKDDSPAGAPSTASSYCHANLRSCKARSKADCTHWCARQGCDRAPCKDHREKDGDKRDRNDREARFRPAMARR